MSSSEYDMFVYLVLANNTRHGLYGSCNRNHGLGCILCESVDVFCVNA